MDFDFQSFFKQGMDRELSSLVQPDPVGKKLNIGAGNKEINGAIPLDWPEWDADADPIPYGNEELTTIYAYHFLEHCRNPVFILQEFQRVLKPGGVANICVPYYTSAMQHHDLDHKNSFTEDTWKILFGNPYYDKNRIKWKFTIGFNIICGIVERNLCLLTQLIKNKESA